MKEQVQLKNLMESITLFESGRYWDNNGAYENEAKELAKLVPLSGPSKTLKGEIFRAAMKIYYDYYNNGFGNSWPEAASFLMGHVKLSSNVRQMLFDHALGNMGSGLDATIEEMMSTTIEQIYTMQDSPNTADMWDTQYSEGEFEPEHDDYGDDDGWEEEDDEDLR